MLKVLFQLVKFCILIKKKSFEFLVLYNKVINDVINSKS